MFTNYVVKHTENTQTSRPHSAEWDDEELKCSIMLWIKKRRKQGICLDKRSDSSKEIEEIKTTKGKNIIRKDYKELQECTDVLESYKHRSNPFWRYQGKEDWVNHFRRDFTRDLVHYYVGLKKRISAKFKEIFAVFTGRQTREPSPV